MDQAKYEVEQNARNVGKTLKRDGIRDEFLKEELPDKSVLQFDNDGNIVLKNRAYRRQKISLIEGNAATTKKRTAGKVRKDRKAERQNKKKGRK